MKELYEYYRECRLCPRSCGVDRTAGQKGVCGESADLYAARAALHFWEEPCISGEEGSGAVFFSGCSLGCIFCQNGEISDGSAGKKITVRRLAEIFLELQAKGANNINLVTPDHYAPTVVQALIMAGKIAHIPENRDQYDPSDLASDYTVPFPDKNPASDSTAFFPDKNPASDSTAFFPDKNPASDSTGFFPDKGSGSDRKGALHIPVICNCSGYMSVDTVNLLAPYVDVWLPDFKYFDPALSEKFSFAPDYFEIASKALKAMYESAGEPEFDEDGKIVRGIIVRHLVLPGHTKDSKAVIKYLYETYGDKIYISIMNQYTPMKGIERRGYKELTRVLTEKEYESVVDYAIDLGVENGFIQEGETNKESFIPPFDYEGV